MLLLAPPLRAIAQLDDPVFLGVVWRSAASAVLGLAVIAGLLVWGGESAVAAYGSGHGWLAWLGGALGGIGAAVLSLYLFLPVATLVAFLFVDRVSAAVERRYYPYLPPARPAPLIDQTWDGIALGLRVLAWQVLTLVLLVTPLAPIAAPLGWLIAAWSVGRGLFVAVAMRRMDRVRANALYRTLRPAVVAQGGLVAVGSIVPVLNLFVPVLGTAAMVHLLHEAGPRTQAA